MASGTADILFKAELDASGAVTGLQAIKGETGKAGDAAGTAAPKFNELESAASKVAAAFAGYVSIQAAVGFLKDATAAAITAAEANARLEGVVRATGFSAGLTAGAITDFAQGLLNLTGTSIATTQSAAAMLATFNVVRGEAFERTLKVANDLAAVWGMDLTSAAAALGRAMTIPEKAALGLRAAHIKLTEAQQAYINNAYEANGIDAARAAILDIVEAKTKGVAEQVALAGGGIKIYAAQWDEAKKSLGNVVLQTGLLQGATKLLADGLKGIANNFSGITAEERNFDSALSKLTTGELTTLVKLMQTTIQQDKDKMKGLDDESSAYLALTQKLAEHERELAAVKVALDGQTAAQEGATAATKNESAAGEAATKAAKDHADAIAADADWISKATYGLEDWIRLQKGETVAVSDSTFVHGMHQAAIHADAQAIKDLAHQTDVAKMAALFAGQAYSSWRDVVLVPLKVDPLIISVTLDRAKAQYEAKWLQDYWGDTVKSLEKSLANVTTSLFEGDANKAWENMWKDASKAAGKIMSDTLEEALFGGQGPLSGDKNFKGILQGGWGSMTTTQKLEAGGQLLGAGLMYYGAQNNDRTAATAGGAVTGFVSGWEMSRGNPIVAAAAAVIMAAISYFSSGGSKSYGYSVIAGSGRSAEAASTYYQWGPGGLVGAGFNPGGPDVMGTKDFVRQLTDVIESTTISMRGLLVTMKQPFASPSWSAKWNDQTADASQIMSEILTSAAPRTVFKAFTPYLQTGMTGIGVSGGRQAEELASFDTGKFDAALASFTAWIQAIMDMGTVDKLLGSTTDELRAKVNETLRGAFLTGFDDTMSKAKELTASLDQMFSSEQVANAQSLLSLANSQYAAGLQYFAQLESISKGISSSTAGVLTGFEEQKAKEAGPQQLADWYKQQLADLNTSLAGATSAEQVQAIMSEILKYGQSLWNVNLSSDSASPDYAFRQQAEADIVAAEKAAQDMIAAWEKEVSDKNALLKDQIDLMTTALESATGGTNAQATSAGNAATSLDATAVAADAVTSAFYRLAAAAATAAGEQPTYWTSGPGFADAGSLGRQA